MFKWFLFNSVCFGNYGNDYYNKFVSEGYDDIRMIVDFDEELLCNEILMKKPHVKLMMRKIEQFKNDCDKFRTILQNLKVDYLLSIFENNKS